MNVVPRRLSPWMLTALTVITGVSALGIQTRAIAHPSLYSSQPVTHPVTITKDAHLSAPVEPADATEPHNAGLVVMASPYSVAETGDRFEALLAERGVTVFARVDHGAGAASVDLELRPTEVIIFGNPRVGTPLMQCGQSIAIDLPQKLLIWENEAGDVYLAYNDAHYLATRHGLPGCEEAIARVNEILMGLTTAVVEH